MDYYFLACSGLEIMGRSYKKKSRGQRNRFIRDYRNYTRNKYVSTCIITTVAVIYFNIAQAV